MPNLGLDESAPFQMVLRGRARSYEYQVVFVLPEKRGWLEQLVPRGLAHDDLFGDDQALLERLLHDASRRRGHVERRVLLGISRSDDGHEVVPIRDVDPRVPDGETQVAVFWLLQQHWLWPGPLRENEEELLDEGGGDGVGVELANSGHEHGPGHATQEAQGVAVDALLLGPDLDGPEGEAEVVDAGHEAQDLVRHAATVQAANALGVEVLQEHVVLEVHRVGHLLEHEPGEEHVDLDAVECHFDHWDEGLFDGAEVAYLGLGFEQLHEGGEVVLPEDVAGHDAEGVDVGAFVVDAQSVGMGRISFWQFVENKIYCISG